MRSLLLAAMAVWAFCSPAIAASKPPRALDEVRQDANRIADRAAGAAMDGEARRMTGAVSVSEWSDLRDNLKAKCSETTQRYWTYWGDILAALREPAHGVPLAVASMQRSFPRNMSDIAKTMPPAGKAIFLRAGETLDAKPADWDAALRQRAEWSALIAALADGIVASKPADDYGANFALGMWTRLECDFSADNTRFVEAYSKAMPNGGEGEDTARALAALQAH